MNRLAPIYIMAALGVFSHGALAFQEGAPGVPSGQPVAGVSGGQSPKTAEPGNGLSLKSPEVSIGKGSGTEVRVPGFGKVGVLPKLDFGLELLYGANEPKGVPEDKSEPADVQIRGTIKHRF